MFHQYRAAFDQYIIGKAGRLQEFWGSVEPTDQFRHSTVATKSNFKQQVIPLALHGDGVPALGVGQAWQKTMEVFSWSSLVGAGTCTLLMNWLVFMFPKKLAATSSMGNTRRSFFKIMRWSLQALWEGHWPARDWKGKPFAADS
eukprot:8613828-Alexandrium_andersonii.AAC.1